MSCCSSHAKDNHMWAGLIAFIIGAVVLLEKFDIIPTATWSYLWPSILVVAGLKLMLGSCESCTSGDECGSCSGACSMPAPKKAGKKK